MQLGERFEYAQWIELAGVSADVYAERERRDGTVPQTMPPGRRGRAEIAIAGTQANAIERRHHDSHHRALGVLDRLRQFARGAGGVLEDRQRIGAGVGREGLGLRRERPPEGFIGRDHAQLRKLRGQRTRIAARDQHRGLAVIEAQRHALRPEQGEQRHGDGAGLDRAEHAGIESAPRFQHHRHAFAHSHTAIFKPMGELAGAVGQFVEARVLESPVGEFDADRQPAPAMPVQAFVGEVHALTVAVEQRPQRRGGAGLLGKREIVDVGQSCHGERIVRGGARLVHV